MEVLKEAIQGRSRWLRKAPLCLAHAQRPLLGAQRQLLLFAAGSAAKEQWFTALSSACAADGGAAAAVEALYETFCDRARANAAVPYPQVLLLLLRTFARSRRLQKPLIPCYEFQVVTKKVAGREACVGGGADARCGGGRAAAGQGRQGAGAEEVAGALAAQGRRLRQPQGRRGQQRAHAPPERPAAGGRAARGPELYREKIWRRA